MKYVLGAVLVLVVLFRPVRVNGWLEIDEGGGTIRLPINREWVIRPVWSDGVEAMHSEKWGVTISYYKEYDPMYGEWAGCIAFVLLANLLILRRPHGRQ